MGKTEGIPDGFLVGAEYKHHIMRYIESGESECKIPSKRGLNKIY